MSNRDDCFAKDEHRCIALKELQCINCRFYRNDLNLNLIEEDIKIYNSQTKGEKKK